MIHPHRAIPVILLALLAGGLAAADPADLAIGPDGSLHLLADGAELCAFRPTAATPTWRFAALAAVGEPAPDAPLRFALQVDGGELAGEADLASRDGRGEAKWTFTAKTDIAFSTIAIAFDFPATALIGGSWQFAGRKGAFPAAFDQLHVATGESRDLSVTMADGRTISLQFPQPVSVLVQDNRKWNPTFHLRVGRPAGRMAAGERWDLAMAVSLPDGVRCRRDLPVRIAADGDWVPLTHELDVEPGSALDLSGLGLIDGPCGAKGRVIATPDGHFAYADDPATPRRFYGVNLCLTAQFLPKAQVDRMLDRLVRLGYNAIRLHHFEGWLTRQVWSPGFDWDPARVDQFDYLVAGCARRGLWLTTDLYVTRPVPGRQIGLADSRPDADRFKQLVPVHEPAYQDWQAFARKLLDRTNPYTGRRLAGEPALAWLSLINEGWIRGFELAVPQWTAAWNRWLAARHPDREALDQALGDLADSEDPAAGTVAMPTSFTGTRRSRLVQVFIADTYRTMAGRMRRFLREELGCQALITDMNCNGRVDPFQLTRAEYDYVDDHFYVDHPMYLRSGSIPSRCSNTNPMRDGAPGGRTSAGLRIWGRPFAISEFNHCSPGRYRGVGGLLVGALASLQDWDALWRFAYAHSDRQVQEPAPLDYFSIANDPLNQAADRAAILLFLRRDLRPAAGRLAVVLTRDELRRPPPRMPNDPAGWLAFTTRIGCSVVDSLAEAPGDAAAIAWRQAGDRARIAAVLADRGITAGADAGGVTRSETGEVVIDQPRGQLTIDTPRTAGGYGEPGQAVEAVGAGVRIDGFTMGATVFVTSLDRSPIRGSRRLLVTHLTDLQNTGILFAEAARKTLQEWGGLPHLVREGSATVRIAVEDPAAYRAWALSTGGRRLEEVPLAVEGSRLALPVRVRGPQGARMLYEVVRR